ncbi:MAG: 5-(carboxyamino)imidazole ribonucleotide synthase [Nitrosomonas sp.]|nr:5-(carboxyamino)imidazole ribonucleotide synthase [Nitrosomonas sp.]MDP1949525.1 5-(carboxyamino)imidazole ribonucleotide synthase [Nitrosomonas sp.]
MSIMPGAMLGLLGGGQLGRMFIMAAQSMGYQVTVLDPSRDSPAGHVADRFLCADFSDKTALRELGTTCAGVTTEFENIPADSLSFLAEYCIVSPDADSVAIAQNRIMEKQFLVTNGFPVAAFAVIQSGNAVSPDTHPELFPGILKVSRFGYDGKGQVRVSNKAELDAAFSSMKGESCVFEQLLPLRSEISVIVARGFDDELSVFPVAENRHVQGILDVSIVPASVPREIIQQASEATIRVAEKLDYRGILCVEFFILADGRLLINEIAPRTHNSGHYTIDACMTSQFEQQVRTLCGLPLGSTKLLSAAVMVNLLGDLWQQKEPDWKQVLQHTNTKLHLYGKREARPGRKMGHYTVLDTTAEAALQQALRIKQLLSENTN